MTLHHQKTDPVVIGSGELYIGKVENVDTATEQEIEEALVNVGAIESGATLEYSSSSEVIKSANRGTIMRLLTDEEVTFNCGVMSWVIDNLAFVAPAVVEDNMVMGGTKTIKIGGNKLPVNYLRFIHKKSDGNGEIIVNIFKATPASGFSFTFDPENPLVVSYEFTALGNKDGNLVEIIETFNDY